MYPFYQCQRCQIGGEEAGARWASKKGGLSLLEPEEWGLGQHAGVKQDMLGLE